MPELPLSTRIVLRDRTHADADTVLLTALDDLVSAGAWRHEARGIVRTRHSLVPADTLGAAPEPLPYVDGLLRTAHGQPGHKGTAKELASWIAVHARSAPTTAVHRTIDDLLERGYLERVATGFSHSNRPTARGEAELAGLPPRERPAAARGKRPRVPDLVSGGVGALPPAALGAWAAAADSSTANVGHGGHDGGGHGGFAGHGGHHGGHHGG